LSRRFAHSSPEVPLQLRFSPESRNFYATEYAYDTPRGWRTRVLLPTGTINRTVYDTLGRVVSTWVGINDTPASGSWSPTNNTSPSNMVQVAANVYDGGSAGGDSNLTQTTQYPGGTAAQRVTQNSYDWRDRLVASKQGVQASENDATHRPIFYSQFDNLNEVVSSERYDGDGVTITSTGGVPNRPSATLLRAKSTPQYDDQGRVLQSNTFSVDQSNGTVSANSLNTNTWYDHRGNVIKTSPPGGLVTKTAYDGARRPTTVYQTDAYLDSTWSDASTVSSNNNVLTQTQTTYDNKGNAILVTTMDRFHNETMGGPLGNPTTQPYARVSYVANYYDAADRLTDSVNVGTNGGTAYTRPSTPPARSNTALVSSTGYKADAVQQVALTGSPTGGTFTLTFGGQTTAPLAYNAAASAVQSALQALSTIGAGNALVSGPAGGPWLVRFAGALAETPEAEMTGNGSGLTGGTSPSVAIGTTSQGGDTGRAQKTTDPRALVTKTDYDLVGRIVRTVENFTAFAPSNGADRTTQYTYDGSNHVLTLTAVLPGSVLETTQYAYTVTGSVINSNDLLATVTYPANGQSNTESYTYNALGEMATASDRNGNTHSYSLDVLGRRISDSVTTLGSNVDGAVRRLDAAYDTGGRPYLFTSYADTVGTTMVNQVTQGYNGLGQLTSESQNHGSYTGTVQYAYSFVATSGGPNHSRLVSMTYPNSVGVNYGYYAGVDDRISRLSQVYSESYSYLGLSTVVRRYNSFNSGLYLTYIIPGGNADGGDQYTGLDRFGRVVEQRWYYSSISIPTDDFLYTYDRDGNRLTRTNTLKTTFNEQYGYDGFNQLTSFTRNTHTQSWSLDGLGNWASFTNDANTQTRTHNVQNQITAVSGATTPTYDNNGDTTTDEAGQTYVYDAWNRPVRVVSGANTVVYAYDALGRRISRSINGNTATDLYYSSSWQVLEEDQGGSMQLKYIWSPVYVDAMVERDNSAGTRLFVQQDANWNVTALVDIFGIVKQRFVYDPYGKPSFYDVTWNPSGNGYSWVYLHQGGRYDSTSGLYNFRHRDYSPTLGRWMQQDPQKYQAGMDLYLYEADSPANRLDSLGLYSQVLVGSGDLVVQSCYRPADTSAQETCRIRGCTVGYVTVTVRGARGLSCSYRKYCASNIGELCDMIKYAVPPGGPRYRQLIITGHCAGPDTVGVGFAPHGMPPPRFTASAIDTKCQSAVTNAILPGARIIIGACGYLGDPQVPNWEQSLQDMADKLQHEVCACTHAASFSLFGCECVKAYGGVDSNLVCKQPGSSKGGNVEGLGGN
jgi:RHS repeat-associated protein